MAENLCSLRKKGGGGKYREYILWQNPSPTSSFSSQTITLSDDMNNYDFIGITFNLDTTTTDRPLTFYYPIPAFLSWKGNNAAGEYSRAYMGNINRAQTTSYHRGVRCASSTQITFANGWHEGSGSVTSSSNDCIPIQVVGIKMGTVKQFNNVKDYIRDKAFNGGFTEITTLTPHSSRVTTNEGKIVADTLNHVVYVYVDFTTATNFGSSSDWASVYNLTSDLLNYLPVYFANSRQNNIPLFTDESSDVNTKNFVCGYGVSGQTYKLALSYGQTVNSGERYILYTMYTYR